MKGHAFLEYAVTHYTYHQRRERPIEEELNTDCPEYAVELRIAYHVGVYKIQELPGKI